MNKILVCVLGLLACGMASAAQPNYGVYGWDIYCKGAASVTVRASQSDDDFYIKYAGQKLAADRVWADATVNQDARLRTLVFSTNQNVSRGSEVTLVVVRKNIENADQATGGSRAQGVLLVDRQRFDLKCYARFGKGEDDFDEVSKKPFPRF